MRKLFKILLCSLALFFVLSHNFLLFATEYTECVVTEDGKSGKYTLPWYLKSELAGSSPACPPTYTTIDSEFDQVLLVCSSGLGCADDISANGITISSALEVKVSEKTIMGNWNYYSVTDSYSELSYADSYDENFLDDEGDPFNWGTTKIDAREVEGVILNCSGTASEADLYIRNTVFLVNQSGTTAPTTELIHDNCDGVIYNAGYTWVCNKTSVPTTPSGDSSCRAINNLAAAATEEEVDADGDGFTSDEDCDDGDEDINPDVSENCDDRLFEDEDCNGSANDEDPACADDGTTTGGDDGDEVDADEDSYSSDEDCDDSDPDVNPGVSETCNEIDDNCDGTVDEDCDDTTTSTTGGTSYDVDGDTYEDENYGGDDCDDSNSAVNPGEEEVCDDTDEVDEDCDGDSNDDDSDCSTDSGDDSDDDGDTFTENEGDCDDTDENVYPGAPETYNQVDDDCDGTVDNGYAGDPMVDDDLDGYCEDDTACTDGMDPGDCDDTDDTISPAADEICEDSIDNNCDGFDVVDDSETLTLKTSALSKYQYNSKISASQISAIEIVNASESGLSCIVSDLPSTGSGGCGCDILGARQTNPVNSVLLMILLAMPVGLVMVARKKALLK